MVFEWDDFGCNHVISDQCQSHDCRDALLELKKLNPAFKCTLFAIPGEMTHELLEWCKANKDWIELAVHGFYHSSNRECEEMTIEDFEHFMEFFFDMIEDYFVKVFRAPGWQISNGAFEWLADNDWIIADQGYNDERRPAYSDSYVNHDNQFSVHKKVGNPIDVEAYHGHVWDVGWNGIYEDNEKVSHLVEQTKEFKFISESFK